MKKKTIKLKQVDDDKFLTIEEAASALNLKSQVIRNYLSTHRLTTYKFKTLTLLDSEEVESYKQQYRNRTRE